mmetsp:Transcript_38124/g.109370  ORF Transcript_38124/g.109370 Transcript_38124/m.109370 type:complete len:242 (-) Transcript_38124:213-938(-)
MRVRERDVRAEQIKISLVLEHRVEVRVPEEDPKLPLAHNVVQRQQPVVRQLRGRAVQKVLDDQAFLHDLGIILCRRSSCCVRCRWSCVRCMCSCTRTAILTRSGRKLRSLLLLSALRLLHCDQPLYDLVVRQVREQTVGKLVLFADHPSVKEDDVQQVEHRHFSREFEGRRASELAVDVKPDVQSRQDVKATRQVLPEVGGVRAWRVAAALVGVEEETGDDFNELVEGNVSRILLYLDLVA